MFINLMEIGENVEFVVDDDPNKQGLYMPGSLLPICDSTSLTERSIGLCLLALSPDSEREVIRKNGAFLEAGGRFASIFPWRENHLPGLSHH